jgi:hypothetical protein
MRPSISYRIGYHDETNINSVEDQSSSNFFSIIGGDVTHWFWPGIWQVYRPVWDWYYLKSLPACTGIMLVPDLGHTRLVWYLIPVFIPVSIPVSDPIYQTALVFDTSVHTSIDTSLWPYIPDQQWSLHSV